MYEQSVSKKLEQMHPNERFVALSRIVNLAAFMLECVEERIPGRLKAIRWMLPADVHSQALSLSALIKKDFVARQSHTPYADTAVRYARYLRHHGLLESELHPTEAEIEQACQPLERPFREIALSETALRHRRAIARGVRYIWQVTTKAGPAHSRVFEEFVPEGLIPRGRSFADLSSGRHREHVVPCLWLYEHCFWTFVRADLPPTVVPPSVLAESATTTVSRLLVIVELSEKESGELDMGRGKNNLKMIMPDGWSATAGCAFERLHQRCINFEMLPVGAHPHSEVKCTCS